MSDIIEAVETVTYIAKPQDSRCQWWSVIIPKDAKLGERLSTPYLKRGADLELPIGTMLIDSEAEHHRKNRGFRTILGVVLPGGVKWINPTMERKQHIKANGGKDLMVESGDVAGCVRMAIWLRRQDDLESAFNTLLAVK